MKIIRNGNVITFEGSRSETTSPLPEEPEPNRSPERCIRCHNVTGKIFGAFREFMGLPGVRLPQPICDSCTHQFVHWWTSEPIENCRCATLDAFAP